MRKDVHSREGDAVTYRAGLSYGILGDDWVVHASTGTGYAPSLYELYSSFGDETLKPEESFTHDIGHRVRLHEHVQFEQTFFYTGWHEAIFFRSGKYRNVSPVSSAYVYGLNTITIQPMESLDIQVDFTYQDSDDGSVNNDEMTRAPNYKGALWYLPA